MTFPTTITGTTNMDAGSDAPSSARAQILLLTQTVNQLIGELQGPITLSAVATSSMHAVALQQLQAEQYGRLLKVTVFTIANNGQTFTPDTRTKSVVVEAVGGGGGGGSTYTTGSTQVAAAGGGASGAYGRARFSSGFSSVTLTIGSGGSGGSANLANAGSGGTTSFGSLLSCPGGAPGGTSTATIAVSAINGGACSSPYGANLGSFFSKGHIGFVVNNVHFSGAGGSSPFGFGGADVGGTAAGSNGSGYGSGGSGAATSFSSSGMPGGSGAPGCIIVWEYA